MTTQELTVKRKLSENTLQVWQLVASLDRDIEVLA